MGTAAGAFATTLVLVGASAIGTAPPAVAARSDAHHYAIAIGLQSGGYYARETGYFDVTITVDGAPARNQGFRLQAAPLGTIYTTPVTPPGGEFRVTDSKGTSRVPLRFNRAGKHRVAVAVGHNILSSQGVAAVTIDVQRRWYRRPASWLLIALGAGMLGGSIAWLRRRRG